jgi:hypothetical protein
LRLAAALIALAYEALERLAAGIALMTDRNRELTDFEDLNTLATSGSRTTAMVPVAMLAAKRFGLDFL